MALRAELIPESRNYELLQLIRQIYRLLWQAIRDLRSLPRPAPHRTAGNPRAIRTENKLMLHVASCRRKKPLWWGIAGRPCVISEDLMGFGVLVEGRLCTGIHGTTFQKIVTLREELIWHVNLIQCKLHGTGRSRVAVCELRKKD